MSEVGIDCAEWILGPVIAAERIKNVAQVFLCQGMQL
jgi:hypothetical protein